MIKEDNHPLLVLEDERVHDLHVSFLAAELHQVGKVLQAFSDHDERAHCCGRNRI